MLNIKNIKNTVKSTKYPDTNYSYNSILKPENITIHIITGFRRRVPDDDASSVGKSSTVSSNRSTPKKKERTKTRPPSPSNSSKSGKKGRDSPTEYESDDTPTKPRKKRKVHRRQEVEDVEEDEEVIDLTTVSLEEPPPRPLKTSTPATRLKLKRQPHFRSNQVHEEEELPSLSDKLKKQPRSRSKEQDEQEDSLPSLSDKTNAEHTDEDTSAPTQQNNDVHNDVQEEENESRKSHKSDSDKNIKWDGMEEALAESMKSTDEGVQLRIALDNSLKDRGPPTRSSPKKTEESHPTPSTSSAEELFGERLLRYIDQQQELTRLLVESRYIYNISRDSFNFIYPVYILCITYISVFSRN